MQPQVSSAQWCKGSQWWAITRAHAHAVVGDRAVYRKVEKYCRVSSEAPPPLRPPPLTHTGNRRATSGTTSVTRMSTTSKHSCP